MSRAPLTHASPNCGPRRGGVVPDMIVIHYTAMTSANAAIQRLCDPAFEVSAHYVLSETGEVFTLVPEEARAWHAGAGAWGDVEDVNSRSVGIELANTSLHPFPDPQMQALERLLAGTMERWSISAARVIGHSDMAIGRKVDPGPKFDWQRLARLGLSIWPTPAAPGDFYADAARFGYRAGPDQATDLLKAFRMRFRPHATGPLSDADCALMANLAARWPCDQNSPAISV